ncbi:hypothetical protein CHREV_146 [Choristoneura rosaceana entomopoxvirus 'L']|uniref:Uncharacterized protein n=1 Tax=Choristoneura rosaceana entomopoxvirus 'L' TaxID=1293539 RepID=A0ABM9QKI0_9POXV|nr:hypothetical protein CHREV_146 [Choristoneura rosaceana entomopoxvirus 'L']CCU56048.1 hypothetical protein CHREV_146 [Choristoneura rosaceana entomopoxvirus 'L']
MYINNKIIFDKKYDNKSYYLIILIIPLIIALSYIIYCMLTKCYDFNNNILLKFVKQDNNCNYFFIGLCGIIISPIMLISLIIHTLCKPIYYIINKLYNILFVRDKYILNNGDIEIYNENNVNHSNIYSIFK